MNTNISQNIPIACDLTAIPAAEREQHVTTGLKIFQVAQEVKELPNGYTFRFNNEPGMFMALANFVENERLCCPFYRFVIEVEPGGKNPNGALWLHMTGGEGVKEFEEAIFIDPHEALRRQLIQTGSDANLNEAVTQAAPTSAGLLGGRSPVGTGKA